MKENFEIIIDGEDRYKIKIEAADEIEAREKLKKFIKFCYEKEIFLEELPEEDDEDFEILDEEIYDLDELYDTKMINILFDSNKPKKAIIVEFE